jgi:hypothetical protein|tara:strand:+ start:294 stop:488 length:195 start_codon:yes stop_codon:yes gene_type:complete
MGSDNEQIASLMRYLKRVEGLTMPNFEEYRKRATLLDECKEKKFPNMERLGLIKKPEPEEEQQP